MNRIRYCAPVDAVDGSISVTAPNACEAPAASACVLVATRPTAAS